ncbi:MAG TPA: hypothetical protein VNC80_09650 [Mycobacteriales bacterium]|nr:hypothetical protein [Mycobacteriales bacterium]
MLTPRTARPVPLLLVLHGRDTTPAQHRVRRAGRARDGAAGALPDRRAGTGWVDPDATARQLIWRFLTSRPT